MDTDSSSFAVVYIYKEPEGALSTVVQLYSEAPAARPPCSAPLLTAHLAPLLPPGPRPTFPVSPDPTLGTCLPSWITPNFKLRRTGQGRQDPAALRRGRSWLEGSLRPRHLGEAHAALWPPAGGPHCLEPKWGFDPSLL